MKTTIKRAAAFAAATLTAALFLAAAGCGRRDKYPGAMRIGTTGLPRNLNPYDTNTGSSTLILGLIYDALLGTVSEPDTAYLPEGADYAPPDDDANPFRFTDNLLKTAGAYPKAQPSDAVGRELYRPTAQERNALLARKAVPAFASAEEQEAAVPSENWLKYTFELVDGHMWNDGAPFAASDIRFTFDYIVRNAGALGAQASFLTNYSHSEVHGDGRYIDIYLGTNKASDIKSICNAILIIPEHVWASRQNPKNESNTDNPVGTGLYKLESFIDGSSITLKLRDGHAFRDALLSPDAPPYISVVYYGQIDVMLAVLNNGDLDTIHTAIESLRADQIRKNPSLYPEVKLSSVGNSFVTTLCFNLKRFGDGQWGEGTGLTFRKAVSLAVDQDYLIETALFGSGSKVGPGLVQDNQPHALRSEDGAYVGHTCDVAEANRILDGAGFNESGGWRRTPTGQPLDIKIYGGSGSAHAAAALKTMFADIKVNFEFVQAGADYSEVVKQSNGADFDAIINSVSFLFDQLLMFDARFGFYSGTSNPRLYNHSGLDDAVLRSLMAAMDGEIDSALQIPLAREVQKRLAGDYAEIPLYSANINSAYGERRYKGWVPVASDVVFNKYTLRCLTKA